MSDDKIMKEFATNLVKKYGKENTLKLMEKLEGIF